MVGNDKRRGSAGSGDGTGKKIQRRWRDYSTAAGNRPVKDFLMGLSDFDRAEIVAAMRDIAVHGLELARHLRGEIWEVRVSGLDLAYRILFAEEGKRGQILLSLNGFAKKTRKTPNAEIETAERRLRDWRERGKRRRELRRPPL